MWHLDKSVVCKRWSTVCESIGRFKVSHNVENEDFRDVTLVFCNAMVLLAIPNTTH